MSGNDFLERFKGKTQTISKEGPGQVLGEGPSLAPEARNVGAPPKFSGNITKSVGAPSINSNKLVSDFVPREHPPGKTAPTRPRPNDSKAPQPNSQNFKDHNQPNKTYNHSPKNVKNPFLISNPFFYDQEERIKHQEQLKIRQKEIDAQQARARAAEQASLKEHKRSSIGGSVDKKPPKEWVKLGGLGANIGGDDWIQKKKKLQKMQGFAEQVKVVNAKKPQARSESRKQEVKAEPNPRQKALEYSKNIPKPPPKPMNSQEPEYQYQPSAKEPDPSEPTQLELYQMRHQKLKNMLKDNHF